ncbi:ATP-binding cassette domain-containing protein, partial [Bacillus cereus]|uniref:ATP-binding cassette domain-containing protein n=1 Tax=Bacillus cereus TaxID=1396 RepID=UPI00201BC623
LQDVSLKVTKGETVELVGMSGGGKSTLVNFIPQFYDVSGGSLLIDGTDSRDYEARSLRNQVGKVLQNTFLFSETIRENIA